MTLPHINLDRRIIRFAVILLLILPGKSYSQEVLGGFKEEHLPILNEELRKLDAKALNPDDLTIQKSSGKLALKLAPVANGGLGEDFSGLTAGAIMIIGAPGDFDALPAGTPDTVLFQGANGGVYWGNDARSNVIHSFRGKDDASSSVSSGHGIYIGGTSQAPDGADAVNFYFLAEAGSADTYSEIYPPFRWTKAAGVDTVTVFIRAWVSAGTGRLRVDIGGQTAESAAFTDTSPTQQASFTVNVLSLTNGTTYDIKVESKNTVVNNHVYLSSMTLISS